MAAVARVEVVHQACFAGHRVGSHAVGQVVVVVVVIVVVVGAVGNRVSTGLVEVSAHVTSVGWVTRVSGRCWWRRDQIRSGV